MLQYDYPARKYEFKLVIKLVITLQISEVKLGNSCVAPQKRDKYFRGFRLFQRPFERVIAVI